MRACSRTAKLCVLLSLTLGLLSVATEQAEAKKRTSSGRASQSASCCKILGLYHPRQDSRISASSRFLIATGNKGN